MGNVRIVAVQEARLDVRAVAASVEDDACGAVVTFEGVVRDHDRGRSVVSIEYEAHPSAEQVLAEIAGEASRRHPGCLIAVEHRVGELGVGEVALVAAASAAHRREAFAALSDLIELVKERLPVWKRQVFADGSDEWTGLPSRQMISSAALPGAGRRRCPTGRAPFRLPSSGATAAEGLS